MRVDLFELLTTIVTRWIVAGVYKAIFIILWSDHFPERLNVKLVPSGIAPAYFPANFLQYYYDENNWIRDGRENSSIDM